MAFILGYQYKYILNLFCVLSYPIYFSLKVFAYLSRVSRHVVRKIILPLMCHEGIKKYLASQKLLQNLDFPRPERVHHRPLLRFQNLLKSLVLLHGTINQGFNYTHCDFFRAKSAGHSKIIEYFEPVLYGFELQVQLRLNWMAWVFNKC